MPLFKRRSSPTAHWSKDFIEHLRTVHFALIALTVIAIISGRAPDVAKMRTAKTQLATIRDFVDNKLSTVGNEMTLYSDWWLLDDQKKIAAQLPRHVPVMLNDSPPYYANMSLQVMREGWTDRPPQSLAEFADLWDALCCSSWRIYVVPAIADKILDQYALLPPQPNEVRPMRTIKATQEALQKRGIHIDSLVRGRLTEARYAKGLKFMPQYGGSHREKGVTEKIFVFLLSHGKADNAGSIIQDGSIIMEAFFYPEVYNRLSRDELIRLESTWTCEGKYANCFEELSEVAAGKKKYRFKDLAGWLDDLISTSEPRQIDVFGIRFPADSQVQWGIILIVTVLLYFWMHLRELSPRLKADHSGLEVAWPGLYRSWTAYAVMWVTVVFLPLYALWILGLNRVHYKSPWRTFVVSNWRDVSLWLAFPLIVYSILSFWSCLKLRKLALLADVARQQDEPESAQKETAAAAKATE